MLFIAYLKPLVAFTVQKVIEAVTWEQQNKTPASFHCFVLWISSLLQNSNEQKCICLLEIALRTHKKSLQVPQEHLFYISVTH